MSSVIGSNLNRIKNILAGDVSSATKTIVGYKKEKIIHKEGDIWEENGKTWTIKDGLKQTFTKLDAARKTILIPLACPKCNKSLKHELDRRAWKITKKCFDCNIEEETRMRADGTFEEHTRKLYKDNAMAWLREKRGQFNDYISSVGTLNGFVTENGTVEDWYGGLDKQKLIDQFEEDYSKMEKIINDL